MSDRFNNIYRIPSARAEWHDYDGGFYHVTICTANRDGYFGKITVGRDGNVMELSPIGEFAMQQFQNVKKHYPYAEIPCFIVMPDHIHAIVYLGCRDAIHRVSNTINNAENVANPARRDAIHRVSNSNKNTKNEICDISKTTIDNQGNATDVDEVVQGNVMNRKQIKTFDIEGDAMNRVSTRGGITGWANPMLHENLGAVIRGLKARITKFAHENDIPFAWQTRFHDRIIRNQEELNATAKYIEDNLIKWPDEEDEGK